MTHFTSYETLMDRMEKAIMPTATDESREQMRKMFGDPIDDGGPLNFLLGKGFTDTAGLLRPPSRNYMISVDEWNCIQFLCDEWDYAFEVPL